jgi:hypothetical protein
MTDVFIPTAREAKSLGGYNQLVVAALCASLFVGTVEQFNQMEGRSFRRKIEMAVISPLPSRNPKVHDAAPSPPR